MIFVLTASVSFAASLEQNDLRPADFVNPPDHRMPGILWLWQETPMTPKIIETQMIRTHAGGFNRCFDFPLWSVRMSPATQPIRRSARFALSLIFFNDVARALRSRPAATWSARLGAGGSVITIERAAELSGSSRPSSFTKWWIYASPACAWIDRLAPMGVTLTAGWGGAGDVEPPENG